MVAVVVCAVYLLITLVAGVLPALSTTSSVTGYVAADRSMNPFVLYFVLGASIFSSFAFLGGPGWAYSRGVAALYIIGYGVLGMMPFYFLGPRARRLGARHGFVTQAEMLAWRFDSRGLSVVLSILSVAVFIPYLVIQMKGAGLILETLSEGRIPFAVGAGVTYGVVVFYVLVSGVLGVGWTNTLQGLFMMIIAWFLGLWLPFKLHGGVREMFEAIAASDQAGLLVMPGLDGAGSSWTWAAFGSAIVVSAVGFVVWPHTFMRAFAARSERALKLTVVLYPTFQLFLVPILFIGFAGVLVYPGVEPADRILPFLLTNTEFSPLLVGLVCAGTLAASMSSGDSILHAAASIGVRDGLVQAFPGRLDDIRQRFWIRVFVVVLAASAFWLAVMSETGLVELLLAAYGGVAQIMPVVLAAFYWRRATKAGAIAGLTAGLVVNTFFFLRPEASPVAGMHEGIWGLLANTVMLVLVSLLTQRDDEDRVRSFVDG